MNNWLKAIGIVLGTYGVMVGLVYMTATYTNFTLAALAAICLVAFTWMIKTGLDDL